MSTAAANGQKGHVSALTSTRDSEEARKEIRGDLQLHGEMYGEKKYRYRSIHHNRDEQPLELASLTSLRIDITLPKSGPEQRYEDASVSLIQESTARQQGVTRSFRMQDVRRIDSPRCHLALWPVSCLLYVPHPFPPPPRLLTGLHSSTRLKIAKVLWIASDNFLAQLAGSQHRGALPAGPAQSA
jgi:hypothetical protein